MNWECLSLGTPASCGRALASRLTAMKSNPCVRLARRMRAFPVKDAPGLERLTEANVDDSLSLAQNAS